MWCVPVQIENLKWRSPDFQICRFVDRESEIKVLREVIFRNGPVHLRWSFLTFFSFLSNIVTKSVYEQYSVTHYSLAVSQGRAPPFSIFVVTIVVPTPWKYLIKNTESTQQFLIIHDPIICLKGTFELMIDIAIDTLSLRMLPARFRWWCQIHFQGKSFLCQSRPGTSIVINVWSGDLYSLVDRL